MLYFNFDHLTYLYADGSDFFNDNENVDVTAYINRILGDLKLLTE